MKSNFHELSIEEFAEAEKFLHYSYCLDDPRSLTFAGNILKLNGEGLAIRFERCYGIDKCKSDNEIDAFFHNTYLGLFYND